MPAAATASADILSPLVTVTAPVVAFLETCWNPFSERTGPEKVVLAILFLLSWLVSAKCSQDITNLLSIGKK